uniref:Cyclin-dependent kinase inhibitor 1 n=1 Tax=Geotrypetes seraphini TaxID=260995 RepID=A0A6P8P1F2_GEOSA|nr:cyclin-dependent kinase inhibitor 1 [Geotrypetes seraphini]XP_033774840.1 cyclin-dependent kinase inhibitor 1 [Geotrypetes seraphini]
MGSSRNNILRSTVSEKVCRNLFGAVDHEQLKRDCQELLKSFHEEAKQKWNFDFVNEVPLEGTYKWERVVAQVGVPAACHQRPLLRALPNQTCPEENERENSPSSSASAAVEQVCRLPLSEEPPQGSSARVSKSQRKAKRKQTVITDFYHSKRRNIQCSPKDRK